MRISLRDPLVRFLLSALLIYLIWYFLYELWIHPAGFLDLLLIDNLATFSSWIIETMGYELIPDQFSETIRTVGIDGTGGLWIGDPCNGLTLFVLFSGFVVAYPGPMKKKLWFIPLGLVAIHLVNLIRIVALLLIIHYYPDPDVLDFNHNYTFTVIVYSFIFFLWYLWAEKFSGFKVNNAKPTAE